MSPIPPRTSPLAIRVKNTLTGPGVEHARQALLEKERGNMFIQAVPYGIIDPERSVVQM